MNSDNGHGQPVFSRERRKFVYRRKAETSEDGRLLRVLSLQLISILALFVFQVYMDAEGTLLLWPAAAMILLCLLSVGLLSSGRSRAILSLVLVGSAGLCTLSLFLKTSLAAILGPGP